MPDLTKLNYHASYNAFKNNNVYTGTLTITGTAVAGVNSRTFDVALGTSPDLVDITFNGPADTIYGSPRPADGWFKYGDVWVPSDLGGGDIIPWTPYGVVSGSTLTVTLNYVSSSVAVQNLTSTNFSYRVIDYSVF